MVEILTEVQLLQMTGTGINTFIKIYTDKPYHTVVVIFIPLEVGKDLYLHPSKHSTC